MQSMGMVYYTYMNACTELSTGLQGLRLTGSLYIWRTQGVESSYLITLATGNQRFQIRELENQVLVIFIYQLVI